MKDTSKELQEVDQIIDLFEKTVTEESETFKKDMEEDGLTIDLSDRLLTMEDEDIKNLGLHDIDNLLSETNCSPDCLKEEYYHAIDKSLSFLEFSIDVLLKIKKKAISIKEGYESLESIKKDRLDISRSFLEMLKSPEYREARLKQLEYLKTQAAEMEDPIERGKIEKKLNQIERSQNFSFLNERLHNIGKKEIESIKDSFFIRSRGTGIMERYYKVLKRLQINSAIHRAFFNLEEKFLPEYYHPFNNFFLFHVIRFISYVDTYSEEDYLYMSSILGALRDLVSQEATEEEKNTILNVMKDFYSFFDDDETIEVFKQKNSNYKFHPDRIQAQKEAENRRICSVVEKIKHELGSLFPESFDESTADEYFKNILQEKETIKEFIETNTEEEVSDSLTYEQLFTQYTELQKSLS